MNSLPLCECSLLLYLTLDKSLSYKLNIWKQGTFATLSAFCLVGNKLFTLDLDNSNIYSTQNMSKYDIKSEFKFQRRRQELQLTPNLDTVCGSLALYDSSNPPLTSFLWRHCHINVNFHRFQGICCMLLFCWGRQPQKRLPLSHHLHIIHTKQLSISW